MNGLLVENIIEGIGLRGKRRSEDRKAGGKGSHGPMTTPRSR